MPNHRTPEKAEPDHLAQGNERHERGVASSERHGVFNKHPNVPPVGQPGAGVCQASLKKAQNE
jgi:hypothetical protein